MTVLKDPYADYRRCLLEGGVSEKAAEAIIEGMKREAVALDRGLCPDCGTKVFRRVDPRQTGASELPGTWVNYRCGCGYKADRKEAVPGISS